MILEVWRHTAQTTLVVALDQSDQCRSCFMLWCFSIIITGNISSIIFSRFEHLHEVRHRIASKQHQRWDKIFQIIGPMPSNYCETIWENGKFHVNVNILWRAQFYAKLWQPQNSSFAKFSKLKLIFKFCWWILKRSQSGCLTHLWLKFWCNTLLLFILTIPFRYNFNSKSNWLNTSIQIMFSAASLLVNMI